MSQSTVKINPLVYVGVAIIFVLSVLPFRTNIKYNDFSKNWLNNDYGKNLLASTEEYSVFMTEGGDNQVFGSLYFTYAVRLRQDLFPYDQKGNIFKRIYGDMRYVTANVIDQRIQMVDKGLFNGQEPFYEAIRTPAPPYLQPYALGKPATYLTWRRPKQFLLGNYYYKTYGLMHKVQNVRYALMDRLSIVKSANLESLLEHATKELGRKPSNTEMNEWVNQLNAEGLVRRQGNTLSFVKDYPKPFARDPRETFITNWEGIKNLPYYDYLSREIVIGYAYDSLVYWGDQIKNWEQILKTDKDPNVRAELQKNIDQAWVEIDNMIVLGKKVGHDSPSILHNMGIIFLSYEKDYTSRKKDMLPLSIELWSQGIKHYPYGWSTYNILLWALVQAMNKYPEESQKYADMFDENLTKMTNAMKHWTSMRGDVTKADPYRQVLSSIQARKNFRPNAKEELRLQSQEIDKIINAQNPDVLRVQNFIQEVLTSSFISPEDELSDKVSAYLYKLWNLKKRDPAYLSWHLSMVNNGLANAVLMQEVYDQLFREAYNLIPTTKNQQNVTALVSLARIAGSLEERALFDRIITRIKNDAKATMSPQEYPQFEQQINAFADSYR